MSVEWEFCDGELVCKDEDTVKYAFKMKAVDPLEEEREAAWRRLERSAAYLDGMLDALVEDGRIDAWSVSELLAKAKELKGWSE